MNSYGYVLGDPINFIDPNSHQRKGFMVMKGGIINPHTIGGTKEPLVTFVDIYKYKPRLNLVAHGSYNIKDVGYAWPHGERITPPGLFDILSTFYIYNTHH